MSSPSKSEAKPSGSPGGGAKSSNREGEKVEANYRGKGKYYPGRIGRDWGDGTYDIDYDDGEKEQRMPGDALRAPGGRDDKRGGGGGGGNNGQPAAAQGWGVGSGPSDSDAAPKRRSAQDFEERGDEILIIPDLEDDGEEDITQQVAAPARNTQRRIPTLRELDADIKFTVPPSSGFDLSPLTATLVPPDSVHEDDTPWEFDTLLQEVTQQFISDAERFAELHPGTAGGADAGAAAASAAAAKAPLATAMATVGGAGATQAGDAMSDAMLARRRGKKATLAAQDFDTASGDGGRGRGDVPPPKPAAHQDDELGVKLPEEVGQLGRRGRRKKLADNEAK